MTNDHDWIDDISEDDLEKLLPTANERSYPLIPSILGTADEKEMDVAINELYDQIDELQTAVRSYLATRTPAAENELRKLVGLDARATFTENENPLVALFAAQGLCYPCENPLDACTCDPD